MCEYRIYIDESGDHTYKNLGDLSRRYLGITGVVIKKEYYDTEVQPVLEYIKKQHFRYDTDNPPILVRTLLIKRKGCFGVLREKERNDKWEEDILEFFDSLQAKLFTVVIDKKEHLKNYPTSYDRFNPYHYSLQVLLNRIKGYLNTLGSQVTADIMPESRGKTEDDLLQAAYTDLRVFGDYWLPPKQMRRAFPSENLLFRKKDHNVAGLQIADLVAADQKNEVLIKNNKPMQTNIGQFGMKLNAVLKKKVNKWGHNIL